jgi:CelD/BcsL family acetyltransferase involved in cellulose biosynthesis
LNASRPLRSGLVARPFEGHAGLAGVEHAWEDLRSRCSLDPLCNRFDWAAAYARAWVPDEDVFGWTLESPSGDLVGLGAFRNEPHRGRFSLPRVRLLTDGSFDSDYLDLFALEDHESHVVGSLIELLTRRAGPQAVVLGPLDSQSRCLPHLREQLRSLSPREERLACPAMELPASFDEYLSSLKKRMRSKVRQALRKVEERGGLYRWNRDPARLGQDLEELFTLHGERWRAIGGEGAFADPRRRSFYGDLLPRALDAGLLRFTSLELDGRVVANQVGLEVEGRYYQLQEGYLPEYEELRVGVALRAWMIEQLIESGTRAYDFMAGASRHKTDWGGTDRTCIELAAALPKPLGRLAYAARRVRDSLRG